MSNRLNKKREAELQPERMDSCQKELENMGIYVIRHSDTELRFAHRGHIVKFFPYSGWHTGKSIKDGRGFKNLVKQLNQ